MVVGTVTGGAVLVVVVVVGMVTGGVGTVGGWVVLGVDVGVPAPPCRVTAPDGVTPIGPMASNTAAAAEVSKRARPGARVLEQSRALMPLSPQRCAWNPSPHPVTGQGDYSYYFYRLSVLSRSPPT